MRISKSLEIFWNRSRRRDWNYNTNRILNKLKFTSTIYPGSTMRTLFVWMRNVRSICLLQRYTFIDSFSNRNPERRIRTVLIFTTFQPTRRVSFWNVHSVWIRGSDVRILKTVYRMFNETFLSFGIVSWDVITSLQWRMILEHALSTNAIRLQRRGWFQFWVECTFSPPLLMCLIHVFVPKSTSQFPYM